MAEKLRAAVIGAGWYAAQNHIPALAARADVALDSVTRLGAEPLARVKEHFGFAFASEDFRDALAREPDIVVVASPHRFHYEHAKAALLRGAHVLCEKPLTLDPAEAWDLAATARARRRHLLVANGYHYLPRVDELRDRLAGGAIGAIEHVSATFVSATRDVFSGERGLDSWKTTFFRPADSTWRDPAQGGGFAYGQASHSIALMLHLTGLNATTTSAFRLDAGGIDLINAAAISFSNGAVGVLSGAAAMPQGFRAAMRFVVTGDEGMVCADFDRDFCEFRRFDGGVERLPLKAGDWVYRCDGPVNALVDLAQGRGVNQSPGETGAATVSLIAAMLSSARSGGAPKPILAAGAGAATQKDRT